MTIKQLATILNGTLESAGIIDQVTGAAAVANEDLSDIVDIGKTVIDYTGENNENFDSFTRDLIDQVGKIMFVDRTYTSQAPNITMDSWEYGSVLEKVRVHSLPEARDNATWDLFNYPKGGGAAYPDPFELNPPEAKAKFFNSKATYEVPITLTQVQLKEAFQSAGQFGSFIAMIENRIRMKMTLCNDGLIMATIDNLIGQKLNAGSYVNLLTLYNGDSATPLSAADALRSTEFLRFASMTMGKYKKYLATASTLYNDGSYLTFTPADKLKFIANTELAKAMDAYLYADTYHNEFVALDGYDEVAFWQGTGTSNGDRLKLDVTVADASADGGKAEVSIDGLVAVMFDRDAAGVCNQNFRTTSIYNPRGEYTNYFYKWDAMYMNDVLENCVVFTIADPDEVEVDDNDGQE